MSDSEKPWFLYVLECRDGSLYTGITVDVEKRFKAHKTGRGAKYTRSRPPLRIMMTAGPMSRAEAQKAEYAFKQLTAAEKRSRCEEGRIS